MNPRLVALADAATEVCGPCWHDVTAHADGHPTHPIWYHTILGMEDPEVFCDGQASRKIVEREHPGLGSKPTKIWRETE